MFSTSESERLDHLFLSGKIFLLDGFMDVTTAEMVKGEWAFLLNDDPKREFHLNEIQFWGIRAE